MRLIDADELINAIEKSRNNNPHKDRCAMRKHDTEHAHFAKMVSDQPTAFDKEKVIKELKSLAEDSRKYWSKFDDEDAFGEMNAYTRAIEVVEKGGIE